MTDTENFETILSKLEEKLDKVGDKLDPPKCSFYVDFKSPLIIYTSIIVTIVILFLIVKPKCITNEIEKDGELINILSFKKLILSSIIISIIVSLAFYYFKTRITI